MACVSMGVHLLSVFICVSVCGRVGAGQRNKESKELKESRGPGRSLVDREVIGMVTFCVSGTPEKPGCSSTLRW